MMADCTHVQLFISGPTKYCYTTIHLPWRHRDFFSRITAEGLLSCNLAFSCRNIIATAMCPQLLADILFLFISEVITTGKLYILVEFCLKSVR